MISRKESNEKSNEKEIHVCETILKYEEPFFSKITLSIGKKNVFYLIHWTSCI